MARAELKAALKELQGSPGFRPYVNTLSGMWEDKVALLIKRDTPLEQIPEIRGELRLIDEMLRMITSNTQEPV